MIKLTVKQEAYCQGIMKGLTQHNAYKQAYSCGNMKRATIDSNASTLRKNKKIVARLKELETEILEENAISVEQVIKELAHIAFDDISNYIQYGMKAVEMGEAKDGTPIVHMKNYLYLKDSEMIDTRSVQEVKVNANGSMSFKMYSKDAALVNLGKVLGLFVEKWEGNLTGDVAENVTLNHKFSTDRIKKAFAALYEGKEKMIEKVIKEDK